MARKPNYNFERRERERQKAEKKAKRAAAKVEAKKAKTAEAGLTEPSEATEGETASAPPPDC